MAVDPNTVAVGERSARCAELEGLRALPRALMGGTKAMRAAGEQFMPRHKAETEATYKARLNGTTLFNAFKDAVLKQNGKLYAEPVALNDDVPPALVALCENIDGQGRALTPFAMDATQSAMVDGVSYILVDFPKLQPQTGQVVVTLADQQRAGARPYWVLVKAQQLLGFRAEDTGGAQQLTQVRLLETITRPVGDYGEETVERVRVLYPGAYEIWEPVKGNTTTKQWVKVEEGQTTNTEIMLAPVYTNRVGFMEGEPPLSSLAELNAEHWLSSSENRHALTFLRFAMLAFTGFSQEELNTVEVGPDKGIAVPTGGTVAYIEHSGKGIDAGFNDLAKIEDRMQSAGMTVRVENAGTVTATTSAINSAETNAGLKAIAKALEDSLAQALQYTADLLKLPEGGHVTVYDGFAEPPPTASVDELIKLRSTSNISRQTLWDILKQRAVLPEDFDGEAEAALLESDTTIDMGAFNGMQNGQASGAQGFGQRQEEEVNRETP
jgi:hypothetical protein